MKILTSLILLGATLAPTMSAHAFFVMVRRPPVVVVPYVAPYPVPVYYGAPAPVAVYDAPPPVMLPPPTPVGSTFYALPAGAYSANVNGVQYYVAGATYYKPNFGPNGVYYEVVTPPGGCGSSC